MTNEKPNNSSNWRNKLDELKSIQGDGFNKETSWDKLHERLHSKSNNRERVWYWLAAACLFFALFISFFLSNEKENGLVQNNIQQKKTNIPFQNAPLINKHTSVVVSSLSTENKMPVHAINKINTNINHKTLSTEIVQNKKEENVIREFTHNAVMPVDTAISIVANLPEKKKLKVVHINELGDPVSESPNIARNNEQHSFQFKFMNQEVYTRSSPAVTKTGFKIFTTKNLTTN
jgi:hypothetical protein